MIGMIQCNSIRSKANPGERCPYKSLNGSEWCGHHAKQTTPRRFSDTISHARTEEGGCRGATQTQTQTQTQTPKPDPIAQAVRMIWNAWNRWVAHRCGPLLRNRTDSNNPADFFSSEPVEEIPLQYFISFVDTQGKGYIMDSRSAISLMDHAAKNHEPALNPFNRAPLSPLFLRRLQLHTGTKVWTALTPLTPAQQLELLTTDVCRMIDDLGYYTSPDWYLGLSHRRLRCLYIELLDIWSHRATLAPSDRVRIVPGVSPLFHVPPAIVVNVMSRPAIQNLVMNICRLLVSTAENRTDRQLGAMYCIGALSIVQPTVAAAYPWLYETFSPGATRLLSNGSISIIPQVLDGPAV